MAFRMLVHPLTGMRFLVSAQTVPRVLCCSGLRQHALDLGSLWLPVASGKAAQYFSHPCAALDAGDHHVKHCEARMEVAAGL
jgi:hypothetical protein